MYSSQVVLRFSFILVVKVRISMYNFMGAVRCPTLLPNLCKTENRIHLQTPGPAQRHTAPHSPGLLLFSHRCCVLRAWLKGPSSRSTSTSTAANFESSALSCVKTDACSNVTALRRHIQIPIRYPSPSYGEGTACSAMH